MKFRSTVIPKNRLKFKFTPIFIIDLIKFLMVSGAVIWLIISGSERLGYHWQWYRIPKYFFFLDEDGIQPGPLCIGLFMTLKITGISLVLSFIVGLITSYFRLSGSILASGVARLYLELIRNTPLLVQIFFIYFVLSPVLKIDAFAAAVLSLSLFEGAYVSEIFRAGILSIHSGQWEAAHSLGMNTVQTYRYVVLPQAMRIVMPPLTGQAISLIKDSALVSTISVYDLTMRGQSIVSETYLTFEIWFSIAAVYLFLTLSLSMIMNKMSSSFG